MQIDGFTVGDTVRRRSGKRVSGVIVSLIPAVEHSTYVANKAPAKARVRWPDRTRIGGNGYSHSTVQLSALVRSES
jgi:hypothetical protein